MRFRVTFEFNFLKNDDCALLGMNLVLPPEIQSNFRHAKLNKNIHHTTHISTL